MKLSIIIVNWNTKELAIKCVDSVLRERPDFDFEIIVVDNASRDGSAEALSEKFGHSANITIIKSATNLGFGKACNKAFEKSSGEFVLFLNPDARVLPGALFELTRFLEINQDAGVVGPKLLNLDGTLQKSVRNFPDIWSSLLVFTGFHRVFRPSKYYRDDFSYDTVCEVEQIMGAALMTRRVIIQKLGLFDEKFWLWYEEVDFCRRVKQAGSKVMFDPRAQIEHCVGKSFEQFGVYERKKTLARSLTYYFQKNGRPWEVMLLNLILPFVLFAARIMDLININAPKSHV